MKNRRKPGSANAATRSGSVGMFRRGTGQEVRTWPMLALLLVVVLVTIGCVLWFLREAMRNERVAMRQTLAQAYRGHLALLQARMIDEWNRKLAAAEGPGSAGELFERCASQGFADGVLCFDGTAVAYPSATRETVETGHAAVVQQQIRTLANTGNPSALARFVLENFPSNDPMEDAHGRNVAANAELLALEEIGNPRDPDFQRIADRLCNGILGDYRSADIPSSQRRFIMREVRRLDPARLFPTLPAEDLAARFLESNAQIIRTPGLHATDLPGIWSACSPRTGRLLYLLTTAHLQADLTQMVRDPSLPAGAILTVEPPGTSVNDDTLLAAIPAGPMLPGWRLLLSIDNRALFDSAAERRVQFLIWVACAVIAAIFTLSLFIARTFGRHARLARLKNDLVATVSHELKTPLTAIRALVDTLIDTKQLDETVTREYLQLIATENARLSRLIDNFLTFSRLERNRFTFDFKPVPPGQIVQGAIAAFGERAHAPGCVLGSRIAADLPPISGDLDALTTALLNLLDNAWKYTGDEKRIGVRAASTNGSVQFEVTDNGIGLSPRESRQVFARFYQSDQRLARNAGGCGLGLSIVQSIAHAHHGTVTVTSEPGRGSTFTIEIPAMAQRKA
jgi:signal transduction histidine kinase